MASPITTGLFSLERLIRRAYEQSSAKTVEQQEAVTQWHEAEEQALLRRNQRLARDGNANR